MILSFLLCLVLPALGVGLVLFSMIWLGVGATSVHKRRQYFNLKQQGVNELEAELVVL